MSKTRLFFVTDVHGSDACFRKFLNAAKFYKTNVLVLGGDITGKTMVLIVDRNNGTYEYSYADQDRQIDSREALDSVIKEIRDSGAYPTVVSQKEYEELNTDPSRVKSLFKEMMIESVMRWMRLAEERLKGTGVQCYISPGNDDIFEIDSVLNSSSYVVNPEEKVTTVDGQYEMITLGYANRTPWNSPRELDEAILETKIEDMAKKLAKPESSIFNIHVPPINTPLDQAPKVTVDLEPVVSAGHIVMTSAGSVATRNAIEKYQPLVGLHGHIHESKGVVKIGRTTCFNPGSEYGEGILRGVVLQLEDGKIRSYLLTAG